MFFLNKRVVFFWAFFIFITSFSFSAQPDIKNLSPADQNAVMTIMMCLMNNNNLELANETFKGLSNKSGVAQTLLLSNLQTGFQALTAEALEILLKHGAIVDYSIDGETIHIATFAAATVIDPNVLKLFCKNASDINTRIMGETALIALAKRSENNLNSELMSNMINILLEAGADPSLKDVQSKTALDYLAQREDAHQIEAYKLLKNKTGKASGLPVATKVDQSKSFASIVTSANENLYEKLCSGKEVTIIREIKIFADSKLTKKQLADRAITNAKILILNEICGEEILVATTKDGSALIKASADSNEYLDASKIGEFSTSKGNIVFVSIQSDPDAEKTENDNFVFSVNATVMLKGTLKTISLDEFKTDDTLSYIAADLMRQFETQLAANKDITFVTNQSYGDRSDYSIYSIFKASAKDKDRGLFRRPKRKYQVKLEVKLIANSNNKKTELFSAIGESEHKVEEFFPNENYSDSRSKLDKNNETDLIGFKEAAVLAMQNFCNQLQAKKNF